MAITVLAPLGYIVFLFGSLYTFSKIYRRRKAQTTSEPWFPPHYSRDIYISLLSLPSPPPDNVLIAALLRRAIEDVRRIMAIRDGKQALTQLLQRGQVGDELFERFTAAEKELEAEIVEVVEEANSYKAGWGQAIFGTASEMLQGEKVRETYHGIAKERENIASQQSLLTSSNNLPLLAVPSLGVAASSAPSSGRATPALAPVPPSAPTASASTPAPSGPSSVPPTAAKRTVSTTSTSAGASDALQVPSSVTSDGASSVGGSVKGDADDDEDEEEENPGQAGAGTGAGKTTPGKKKKNKNKKKKSTTGATGAVAGAASA